MKFKNAFQSLLAKTCIYFTLFSILFLLFAQAAELFLTPALDIASVVRLLLFSFVFSAAALILKIKKYALWQRIALNFSALYAGFALLCVSLGISASGSFLILSLCFAVIYAILISLYVFFLKLHGAKTEPKDEYQNIYMK